MIRKKEIIGIIFVAIVLGTMGCFYFFNKQSTHSPQGEPVVWKNYSNDKLGISFNYPSNWGEPAVDYKGNVNNTDYIKFPPCQYEEMEKSYIAKPYTWIAYTSIITFPKAPVNFEVKILDLDFFPKAVCDPGLGKSINLSEVDPQNQISNKETLITNKMGVRFASDPSIVTSINSSLEGPNYLTRHNNTLVWIDANLSDFSSVTLGEQYFSYDKCKGGDVYNTAKGCGLIAWFQTDNTAEKVRQGFDSIKDIVDSVTFLK